MPHARVYALAFVAALLVACGGTGGGETAGDAGAGADAGDGGVEGLTSTIPAPNAEDVDVGTTIRATFAENVDPALVTEENFWVEGSSIWGATPPKLPGTLALGSDGRTIIFTPAMPLEWDAAYTVHAAEGLGLRTEARWTFFTSPGELDGNAAPPRVVTFDYLDLSTVDELSKFRSSAGHDYSDDFETCRSMKHYFTPAASVSRAEDMPVFAPFDGWVLGAAPESNGLGSNVVVRSRDEPGIEARIFHVALARSFAYAEVVRAGDLLGTHASLGTDSDIAIQMNVVQKGTVPDRHGCTVHCGGNKKLVSYFDVMTDAVFHDYEARGVTGRGDLVISEAARDAMPLTCTGEAFDPPGGSAADWVMLE